MIRALIDKLLGSREELSLEVNKETKIEDLCFVVFDTETTGLDLKKDEALSIGAVKIENLRIDLSKDFYALLKPTKEYNESIKVHGITPEDLRSARERKEICMEFLEYARGCILAGYFLQIDISMLKKLIQEECGFSL